MGLFDEQIARKPDHYPWASVFIDKIWAGFWTANEFDFASDYQQFMTELSEDERAVIVRTLSAIGQVEVAVKTFWAKLGENFRNSSMSDLGFAMANSEVIHGRAYEKLLDRLQMGDVFEANLKVPALAGRVAYLRKYLRRPYGDDKRKQYVYALILFTLFVENVSLFSQFYIVLHFNRFKNVLKDTAQQVSYTRIEENLHAQVGIKIINTLRDEYPELFDAELIERVRNESIEAFAAESAIIDWIIGDYEDGEITGPVLKTFIANRMNESLQAIGFETLTDVDPVLLKRTKWMDEEVLGNAVVDFFHARPTAYAKKNRVFNEDDLF